MADTIGDVRTIKEIVIRTLATHLFAVGIYGHYGSLINLPGTLHAFLVILFIFHPHLAVGQLIFNIFMTSIYWFEDAKYRWSTPKKPNVDIELISAKPQITSQINSTTAVDENLSNDMDAQIPHDTIEAEEEPHTEAQPDNQPESQSESQPEDSAENENVQIPAEIAVKTTGDKPDVQKVKPQDKGPLPGFNFTLSMVVGVYVPSAPGSSNAIPLFESGHVFIRQIPEPISFAWIGRILVCLAGMTQAIGAIYIFSRRQQRRDFLSLDLRNFWMALASAVSGFQSLIILLQRTKWDAIPDDPIPQRVLDSVAVWLYPAAYSFIGMRVVRVLQIYLGWPLASIASDTYLGVMMFVFVMIIIIQRQSLGGFGRSLQRYGFQPRVAIVSGIVGALAVTIPLQI